MKRRHALAAGLVLAASAVTGAAAEPLTGKALRDEAVSIAKVLRCPVSPNLTLYESESAIASELKGVIYEKLRAGETREHLRLHGEALRGADPLRARQERGDGRAVGSSLGCRGRGRGTRFPAHEKAPSGSFPNRQEY